MTAVEWLYNHLFPKQLDGFSHEEWNKIDLAFKQAKEMEKEQHDKTAEEWWKKGAHYMESGGRAKWESFEQYYNETYGK